MPFALLASLMSTDVVWRGAKLADYPAGSAPALFPEEELAIHAAVPKRQREFAIGRQCARDALRALTGLSCAIPVGEKRAPVWPSGVVGSISHDAEICAAVVARQTAYAGLGIDTEVVARFQPKLAPEILTPAERESLTLLDSGRQQARMALYFSVKEAIYKAQQPVTQAWLGFEDVVVTLPDGDAGVFSGRLLCSAGMLPEGYEIRGNCALGDGRSAAIAVLPPTV